MMLRRPSGVWEQLGERHRLGGVLSLRNTSWPSCPGCDEQMSFYGQRDGLPRPSEFDLADAGLTIVFVCFGCFEVAATFESV